MLALPRRFIKEIIIGSRGVRASPQGLEIGKNLKLVSIIIDPALNQEVPLIRNLNDADLWNARNPLM